MSKLLQTSNSEEKTAVEKGDGGLLELLEKQAAEKKEPQVRKLAGEW